MRLVCAAHLALDSINIFHSSTAPPRYANCASEKYSRANSSLPVGTPSRKCYPSDSIPARRSLLTRCHSTGGKAIDPTRQSFFLGFWFFTVIKLVLVRVAHIPSDLMEGSEQEMGIPRFFSSSRARRINPDGGAVFPCPSRTGKEVKDNHFRLIRKKVNERNLFSILWSKMAFEKDKKSNLAGGDDNLFLPFSFWTRQTSRRFLVCPSQTTHTRRSRGAKGIQI